EPACLAKFPEHRFQPPGRHANLQLADLSSTGRALRCEITSYGLNRPERNQGGRLIARLTQTGSTARVDEVAEVPGETARGEGLRLDQAELSSDRGVLVKVPPFGVGVR